MTLTSTQGAAGEPSSPACKPVRGAASGTHTHRPVNTSGAPRQGKPPATAEGHLLRRCSSGVRAGLAH